MKKVALFAFNGEIMCFVHAMLNAIDLYENGYTARLIIEGTATKQIVSLMDERAPSANLYKKVKELNLIDCVCKACASKMGSLNAAIEQQLPLCDEMSGHPSIRRYKKEGYEVINY